MRTGYTALIRVTICSLLVGILSGCRDEEALTKAGTAYREVTNLKTELETLRKDLIAQQEKINGIQTMLNNRIKESSEGLDKRLVDLQLALDEKARDLSKQFGDRLSQQIKTSNDEFDARLKVAMNQDVASRVQTIRDDIQKMRDDLVGFMDKQLKELYPYAYQPRRMEDLQPPQPPQP